MVTPEEILKALDSVREREDSAAFHINEATDVIESEPGVDELREARLACKCAALKYRLAAEWAEHTSRLVAALQRDRT